jgi:hypothetical protein
MVCRVCGKEVGPSKKNGQPKKYCSSACRSIWGGREWRKRQGDAYRAYHRETMRKARARFIGPKNRSTGYIRLPVLLVDCNCPVCLRSFHRVKRGGRQQVYCSTVCRNSAKRQRSDLRFIASLKCA